MSPRSSRPVRRRTAAGAGALLLATLAACGGTAEPSAGAGGGPTYYGQVLDLEPYVVPDLTLTSTAGEDAAGTPYSLAADSDADLTLVFFGYTNCPDICQMVMGNLANALARLGDDRDRVDVLFVTTDPARDTVAALRTYLGRFDPAFLGITGDLAALQQAGESFHVYFDEGVPLPSGGYDVTHSDQVYAVTPDDTVPMLWTRETSPHEYASDVLTLLAGIDA